MEKNLFQEQIKKLRAKKMGSVAPAKTVMTKTPGGAIKLSNTPQILVAKNTTSVPLKPSPQPSPKQSGGGCGCSRNKA